MYAAKAQLPVFQLRSLLGSMQGAKGLGHD